MSTTRFFSVRLITTAMHTCGHTRKQARPRPAVCLTFSRNARRILPGYALQPSVHTSSACKGRQHARTCASKRSARLRSRVRLTTPPNHKRVDTIMAKPIQAMILHPFTRISSARPLLQVQLPLLHHCLMNLLTMLSCSIAPTRHGAFVQAKGLHNRLDRTAIGKPRHHDHHQGLGFAQSLKHPACICAKGLPTGLAAIPRTCLPMAHAIALPDLSSCHAVLIRAKYLRSIHLL